jgi:GrpB-like predicted nucleotidyltransferase (UPF0157 family)
VLGLRNDLNILCDYHSSWVEAFALEKALLECALTGVAKGIEHFGSTSVPGMRAKPILDILVGVSPVEVWQRCKVPLESLGYEFIVSAGIPHHQIFSRGRDQSERTHILHIVDYDSNEWSLNLAFRDALRSDSDLRARYIAEKERAAAAAPEGRAKYTALKNSFISGVKAKLTRTLDNLPAE